MMYSVTTTRTYRTALKRLLRSGRFSCDDIDRVVSKLQQGVILEAKYHDHALTGVLRGYRECHVRPDLLLVYTIQDDVLVLVLVNIGSHADLFGR